MVNAQILKDAVSKVPVNLPNGGAIIYQIFKAHPELRNFYDVEDIDVDDIPKSRNMQQRGAGVLSSIRNLIMNIENEKQFRSEVKELTENFKELKMTAADVKKMLPGVIAFFDEKCGKLSDAQKKEFVPFFDQYVGVLKECGM